MKVVLHSIRFDNEPLYCRQGAVLPYNYLCQKVNVNASVLLDGQEFEMNTSFPFEDLPDSLTGIKNAIKEKFKQE